MSFLKKYFTRNRQGLPVQEQPKPKLIDSIADWKVYGLIQACFYEDYSSIGIGTPEELQAAFAHLLCQYHDTCRNEFISHSIKLRSQIKNIELQWEIVNRIAEIMKARYSETGAKILRERYPNYLFTPESIDNDLSMVGKGEIANQIKYERLCNELEKLEKGQKKDENLTVQQKHANFLNRLMDINKHEGVKYDIQTMSVLELAIAENRLTEYIEQLQEQMKENERVN